MSTWMKSGSIPDGAALPTTPVRLDFQLRCVDLVLAGLATLLLALPMVLALMVGRLRAERLTGRHGRVFRRFEIELPHHVLGRWIRKTRIGAAPVLFNILRGDLAWIGHRALAADADDEYPSALAHVRPGLVSIWRLRQRTAVDFGSELEADLEYLGRRGLGHDLGLLLRAGLTAWMRPCGVKLPPRVCVGDVTFDNLTMSEAIARIGAMLDGQAAQQVSFVNAACINIAARDRGYRRLLARAALVLPDGIGIKLAADLMGSPLKQNVNGTDLFPRLCEMLQARDASLFLLGGKPGVAERVAAVVRHYWPSLRIAGVRDGYFDLAQEGEVAAQVRASRADVVLVARGVPVQDQFIDRHLHQLGVKVAVGVGGLFDFVSGRIARAPSWMRDSGLEWIYRLRQEPARMWRRYLLGNFSFLGRIVLQRLGLRRTKKDHEAVLAPPAASSNEAQPGLRTVLFATAFAPSDVPVPDHYPAALLPLGCSSFIERALDQLADAGIRELDLVVSAQPEEFRRMLGEGERWGMRLRWHLVKDAATPYGVLRALGLASGERLLIGHAQHWISAGALSSLLEQDHVVTQFDADLGMQWTGWASLVPTALGDVSLHSDEAALGSYICAMPLPLLVLEPPGHASTGSAAQLMDAQTLALSQGPDCGIPATWVRTSWGARSPDALVQAGAHIEGPALIGPGCLVARGARIEAGTVLSHNVVLAGGARVARSLVLPHTYVGADLDLCDTIVNARSVQHLRLDVRTTLPSAEGLLLDLQQSAPRSTPWASRALAVLVCAVFLPWLIVDTALRRLRGLPLRWTKSQVVLGREADGGSVRTQALRRVSDASGSVLAHFGSWLDVVAGRRSWFGARPRSESEWYGLSRDWQVLLADAPIGCFHAPAWCDAATNRHEAQAAADVFLAVNSSRMVHWRTLLAAFKR